MNLLEYFSDKAVWLWMALAGLLGRLIYHSRLVQSGRRKFFSKALPLEVLIALGMGFITHGVCSHFGFTGDGEIAVVIIAGYIGPQGIDSLWSLWLAKQAKG